MEFFVAGVELLENVGMLSGDFGVLVFEIVKFVTADQAPALGFYRGVMPLFPFTAAGTLHDQ